MARYATEVKQPKMKHINHAYLLAIGVRPAAIPAALQTLPKEVVPYWVNVSPKWFQRPGIVQKLEQPAVELTLTGAIKHLIWKDITDGRPAKLSLIAYNMLLQKSYDKATKGESRERRDFPFWQSPALAKDS